MTAQAASAKRTRPRSSNFELMRIVLMLLIVANHLLSNSGLYDQISLSSLSNKGRAILLFSMWGKTAINPFVMVTGYFMCTSRLTLRRVVKLYAQVKLYRLAIFAALAAIGYQELSRWDITSALFNVARFAGGGFTVSFIAFYVFIPFYNKLIGVMGEREHGLMLAGMLFWQTLCPLLFGNTALFNEVMWYLTLYFIGAYLRLYPKPWTEARGLSTVMLVVCVAASMASVIYFAWRGGATGQPWYYSYRWVSDSNKIFALLTGVAIFLFVKNHPLGYHPLINTVASTAFGVLLIHASSQSMNRLVWKRLAHTDTLLSMAGGPMLVRAVLTCVTIFAVCSVIDYLRIQLLEKPFLRWYDEHGFDECFERWIAGEVQR